MKFAITGSEVTLLHLNVRAETHGDADVSAIDLKFQWDAASVELAQFHPALLSALYELPAAQDRIEGTEPLRVVRVFNDLAPIHWRGDSPCVLSIHHGLGDHQDITLADAVADGFVIEALEGGSIRVTFRVRAVCQDERILGRLPLLLRRSLPMSVAPVARRPKPAKGLAVAEAANDEQADLLS